MPCPVATSVVTGIKCVCYCGLFCKVGQCFTLLTLGKHYLKGDCLKILKPSVELHYNFLKPFLHFHTADKASNKANIWSIQKIVSKPLYTCIEKCKFKLSIRYKQGWISTSTWENKQNMKSMWKCSQHKTFYFELSQK